MSTTNGVAGPTDSAARPRLPYPSGWFPLAFSDELRPGQVRRERFMGEDVVLYRTRSGLVRATNPHCPHLGAHLGYGGWVDGECLVCPFHGFAFDPAGACVRTGYGTQPRGKIGLALRHVEEVNDAIFVWYHPDGRAPDWHIPAARPGFPRPVRRSSTLLDHPQEVTENMVDVGHLAHVHNVVDGYEIVPPEFDGPLMRCRTAGAKPLPFGQKVKFDIVTESWGLGHTIAHFVFPRFGLEGQHLWFVTATDPTHVMFRYTLALNLPFGNFGDHHPLGRLVTLLAAPNLVGLLTGDYPIWENKIYLEHPRLMKGDGSIGPYRRWAKQFYGADRRTAAGVDTVPAPALNLGDAD
ncbi:Rieske (2Fe-2S) protein [Nocardia colli]|uniref:cholesterol 7-desaturase n=1 Tax=Nocardia colli TaxID=2545717 RepID=A0A5N0EN74_9NOCA|nr:Rieske 2Fe-2S domain-containing protein [Nocardia colli]KAA8889445.1 Rieske (2Fe-2S) protein [Nocardia colli]